MPPHDTPFGFRLAGNEGMANGRFEKEEIHLFLQEIKGAEICLDVGANIGLYSCLAASLGKQVVAVEPLASNLAMLYRNLEENSFHSVEVFPLGLASEGGLRHMFGRGTGASFLRGWAGASERFSNIVPVTTLDTLVGHRFDGRNVLIKIDVEGFEYDLLRGAQRTLCLTPRPTWLIEICLGEHFPGGANAKFRDTFELFWQMGYEAMIADSEQKAVNRCDVDRWVKKGSVDFGSHNYIFRKI